MTYVLPASSLATNGDYVEIEAWGTGAVAGAGETKTVKLYFGATVLNTLTLVDVSANTWFVKATVVRTAAATQEAISVYNYYEETSGYTNAIRTTPAETLSEAITIKCTGTATNTDDIIQKGMTVKWYPAN